MPCSGGCGIGWPSTRRTSGSSPTGTTPGSRSTTCGRRTPGTSGSSSGRTGRSSSSAAGPGDPCCAGWRPLTWRLRRTGTTADGRTIVVHEAVHHDAGTHLQVAYNRVEAYDADGHLQDTWLRRQHLRLWPRPDAEALFTEAGLTDVHSTGLD